MPVVHTPDTPYAQEMRRHEANYTIYGSPGRPYEFREYPAMMYRFVREAKTGTPIPEGQIAADEHARRNLESRGFVFGGQGKALDVFEAEQTEHAKLAAELNYDVKNKLSERAAREVTDAQQTFGAQHLPVVPETPIKAKGWPKGKPRAKKIAPIIE